MSEHDIYENEENKNAYQSESEAIPQNENETLPLKENEEVSKDEKEAVSQSFDSAPTTPEHAEPDKENYSYSYTPSPENSREDIRNYEAPEKEERMYTYSYGSNGSKENVTGRYNAPQFENTSGGTYPQNPPRAPYARPADNAQRPGYMGSNPYSTGAHSTADPTFVHTAPIPPKAPKKTSSVKTSTAVLLCVACVILSFAVSIFGSVLVYKSTGHTYSDESLGNGVVMYREVETKTNGNTTVSDIVETVQDSVVEITTEYVTNNNFFFGQYVSKGAGSGVIVSTDGYIVTNNHVICDTENGNKQADSITVRLRNGKEYLANIIGTDADADIAIIKIQATDLSAAVWGNSDEVYVGEQVVAIGNPLGSLGGTLTVGYISAKSREIEIDSVKMTLIQTDAAVNPGNSGGGLFDLNGNLIGIVNAKSSGTGVEGLGFAIPANDARETVEQLLEYGYVKDKVFIGVSFYEYNSGFYSSFGSSGMLMVYGLEEGYNDSVLKPGDIVLSVEDNEVSSVADIKAVLKEHKVGDKLTFSILRNKTAMDVEVECFEYNPTDSSVSFER